MSNCNCYIKDQVLVLTIADILNNSVEILSEI